MWSKSRTTSLKFQRYFSVHAKKESVHQGFRTSESSALNHSQNNLAQFYKLDEAVRKNIFTHGGLPTSFVKQTKTFTEACIMVREPALEVIDLMKKSDLSKPVNRFVLYGDKGTGKSLTLAHLIHYAYESGFLLVHVPWVPDWIRRTALTKEVSNSATREGFVEIPLDAAEWLVHFKLQNQAHLKNGELKISKEYVWSKREVTPVGTTLLELIDLGINRIKYSNEVIVALIDEIKILSTQGVCKTFVAVDGFNSFYYPETRLKIETRKKIPPQYVTLTLAIKELTKNDWCNAVSVITVDKVAVPIDHQETYYPRYLLTKEGFEHLDPFIPIEVKNYNEKEFASCTDYYRDRLWLREGPDTVKELATNSAKNPYNLMEFCAPL